MIQPEKKKYILQFLIYLIRYILIKNKKKDLNTQKNEDNKLTLTITMNKKNR